MTGIASALEPGRTTFVAGKAICTSALYERLLSPVAGNLERVWLNDDIIDGFLTLVQRQAENTFCFSTQVYEKLTSEGNFQLERVATWFRRRRASPIILRDYDTLLMPIHVNGNHWILVHVNVPHQRIRILDSLAGSSRRYGTTLRNVSTFLCAETGIQDWTTEVAVGIARQTSGWECGYFVVGRATHLALDSRTQFTQQHVLPTRRYILHALLTDSLSLPPVE
jgi:Ulp1 family protease